MRIVVKIGTSTLAHPGGRLNIRHTEALVKVWSDIKNAGHELIIVSSGATGLGVGKLQISRPKDMVTKQAAAAVGQCELMYFYDKLFTEYNHIVAQLLLTDEDIRKALGEAFIEIAQTDEGKEIISVFSQVGYTWGKDSDYDGERDAQAMLKSAGK